MNTIWIPFRRSSRPGLRGVWFWLCLLAGCGSPLSAAAAATDAPPPAVIETRYFRLTLWPENGRCEILDKQANVTWRAGNGPARFGTGTLNTDRQQRRFDLTRCSVRVVSKELKASFFPDAEHPLSALHVILRALPGQRTLEVSYQEENELSVENISLLDDVLGVADAGGYIVVPVREGILVPANSGLSFTHRFDTYAYEGCHMAMFGAVQGGAAALVTWRDPYVALNLKSAPGGGATNALPAQRLSPSLFLSKSARAFRVQFLGKGDYVTLAKSYRQVARENGWLVTWDQKLKTEPERAKLFGAANIKLWSALTRRMNEDSTKEESVRVNWTFEEAARIAEHYKQDLKLDRVLFMIGGWIHRGYDNQHPDILPTAPECGGDAAFADCARRVRNLGYLFCLHDNYQDIYRDAPSWDERLIMKTAEGKPARGGHWAGGVAYLVCSQKGLELARRPQNLPGIKSLSGANSYFIDTTYAAGLQECFDPAHALTRVDDMRWKQALSDFARDLFGVFGSECGREWALPHSDFFEGLTGVSGGYFHDANLLKKLGGTVVPLFELVYRDCIAMYGKYGYDPQRAGEYVLHHISLGRPLNYHSIPAHLYWQSPASPAQSSPAPVESGGFTSGDNGWTAGLHPMDRFIKNTCEILSPLNELTAQTQMSQHQFLTPDRAVRHTVFGEGARATEVTVNMGPTNYACRSRIGGEVVLPPYGFLIESPEFAAFRALTWAGRRYTSAPLFTLRSLDGRALSRSHRVRVYHGFGDAQIEIGKHTHEVRSEAILDPARRPKPESAQ